MVRWQAHEANGVPELHSSRRHWRCYKGRPPGGLGDRWSGRAVRPAKCPLPSTSAPRRQPVGRWPLQDGDVVRLDATPAGTFDVLMDANVHCEAGAVHARSLRAANGVGMGRGAVCQLPPSCTEC